jgi:hypothetical protein
VGYDNHVDIPGSNIDSSGSIDWADHAELDNVPSIPQVELIFGDRVLDQEPAKGRWREDTVSEGGCPLLPGGDNVVPGLIDRPLYLLALLAASDEPAVSQTTRTISPSDYELSVPPLRAAEVLPPALATFFRTSAPCVPAAHLRVSLNSRGLIEQIIYQYMEHGSVTSSVRFVDYGQHKRLTLPPASAIDPGPNIAPKSP